MGSDQERLIEELRQSEEKFAKVFQTSPYAITITRAADGSFVDVNDAFTKITGFTRAEALVGSSIGLKLWANEADRQRVVTDLGAGRAVVGQEFQFRTKSGQVVTCLFSAQVILLDAKPCILSSIEDITERKRAEVDLKARARELQDVVDVQIGRENIMIALEHEVNALLKELGREPKYK
jgi:two-component system NtrC family sensor kinase